MILIMELILILNVFKILDILLPGDTNSPNVNNNMYYNHLRRTIIFLVQDVAFGYFWLIFRSPRDVFSVYSEFSKLI